MKRSYRDYILDILTSIDEIEEFTEGMDFEEFIGDRKTINAVIRSLEVMGEAAKKIPRKIREKYPDIPWKYLVGMRDKLIHEYHGVDLGIVWEVVKTEIPPLRPRFERILRELEE
ncbi:MAG: DUF86 domain-containing protein [Candidatus Korarchaeota archaeon]|nr:DUF86 domain-containing protein [Candidatus Korarchaeota archaeon]